MYFFEASLETIYWRFILLMAIVIAPFFLGIPWMALLALPLFISCMLGISFRKESSSSSESMTKKILEKGQIKNVA